VRGVSRFALVALMLNMTFGAGIFGLPSKVHALAGTYGLLAYVACAFVIGCIALCVAEVSSRFTLTGGPYLYAQVAFGPLVGFLVGWLMWVTRVCAIAAISNVMASYLAFFWAPAASGWRHSAVIGAVLAALTAINLVGVRRAAGAASALTIGKLIPLLLFVVVGLFFVVPHRFANAALPSAGSFTQAVLLLIFAFGGFEASVIIAGESGNPRRDMPLALLVSLASATVIYLLIQIVCIGTLPALATSETPLAAACVQFAGPLGGAAISLGALIATFGSLCASILLGSRLPFAMAEQNQLPRWFARTNDRFRTPHVAIVITAGIAAALAITGSFTYLFTLSAVSRLLCYLSAALALPVLRNRGGRDPASFTLPAAGFVVTLTVLLCVWLMVRSGARELRDVAIALAAGVLLHLAHRASRRPGTAGSGP
jgi:basic amino acid/polyamine antiporter, APA family